MQNQPCFFYTYITIKWTLIIHPPASHCTKMLPPGDSSGNYSSCHHTRGRSSSNVYRELDDISNLSATIKNVTYLFCASSISKWCVSLQFIWAIGGLISCRRHLHLAMFFVLFCFVVTWFFYRAVMCQNAPLSASTSFPFAATITQPRVLGGLQSVWEVV